LNIRADSSCLPNCFALLWLWYWYYNYTELYTCNSYKTTVIHHFWYDYWSHWRTKVAMDTWDFFRLFV